MMAEPASVLKEYAPTRRPQQFAVLILLLVFGYVIIGIPSFDRNAPLASEMNQEYVSPVNRFIWLAFFAACLPFAISSGQKLRRLLLAAWPLVGLHVYFLLSATWALDPSTSARRILFAWVQILVAASLVTTIKKAQTLHKCIAFICFGGAVADLLIWIVRPGYAMTSEGLAGFQEQKNSAGLLMMYGLLATGSFLLSWLSTGRRWVYVAECVLMFGLLLATKSKTSLVIVLLMPMLLAAGYRLRTASEVMQIFVAAFAVGIIGMSILAYMTWCAMSGQDIWSVLQGITFTSRTDIWSFMLDEISQRPILGAGYSSFWSIKPSLQPSLKTSMWFGSEANINEAHNGYLDLLATGGCVGFVLGIFVVGRYLYLSFKAIKYNRHRDKRASAFFSPETAIFHFSFMLALIIHNFTESNLFTGSGMIMVCFYFIAFDLEKWELYRKSDEDGVLSDDERARLGQKKKSFRSEHQPGTDMDARADPV